MKMALCLQEGKQQERKHKAVEILEVGIYNCPCLGFSRYEMMPALNMIPLSCVLQRNHSLPY